MTTIILCRDGRHDIAAAFLDGSIYRDWTEVRVGPASSEGIRLIAAKAPDGQVYRYWLGGNEARKMAPRGIDVARLRAEAYAATTVVWDELRVEILSPAVRKISVRKDGFSYALVYQGESVTTEEAVRVLEGRWNSYRRNRPAPAGDEPLPLRGQGSGRDPINLSSCHADPNRPARFEDATEKEEPQAAYDPGPATAPQARPLDETPAPQTHVRHLTDPAEIIADLVDRAMRKEGEPLASITASTFPDGTIRLNVVSADGLTCQRSEGGEGDNPVLRTPTDFKEHADKYVRAFRVGFAARRLAMRPDRQKPDQANTL